MKQRIKLSMCEYQDGEFELFIEGDGGLRVEITGKRTWDAEQSRLMMDLIPACVMTTFERDAL